MFGLVDCNSFFASCEKVFVPRLKNRPVIVLSNNDGCVVARSPEAKALGIAMGAPFFQIRSRCEELGIAVFSANFELYSDMSRRVMQTLRSWCPSVEVYSIDEAFLDLRGIPNAETEPFQRNVVETVWKWTGIPVAFGVAPTKTLAKAAVYVAKTQRIPSFTLNDAGTIQETLREIPVDEVWGIGRRLLKPLLARGVRTAWDLSRQDPIQIRRDFSICQERTVRELRGEPCLELENLAPPKYSVQVSRSFGKNITTLDELAQPVSAFLGAALARLRKYALFTNAVWIALHGFTPGPETVRERIPYSEGFAVPLEGATSDALLVLPRVLNLLRKKFRPDVIYQKAGVTLMAIANTADSDKYRMFQTPEEQNANDRKAEARQNLMNVLDALHRDLGRDSIVFASEGLKQEWQSRQERKSPAYTTNWSEIPEAGD